MQASLVPYFFAFLTCLLVKAPKDIQRQAYITLHNFISAHRNDVRIYSNNGHHEGIVKGDFRIGYEMIRNVILF